MNRKDYLVSLIEMKIKEVNSIIGSASEKCSQLKILFITLCMPATATLISLYFSFTRQDSGNIDITQLRFAGIVVSAFYALVLFVGIFLHYSFYARQYRYRKVKSSLFFLREKLIFFDKTINEDITSEVFDRYYHAIVQVSAHTNETWKILRHSIKDALSFIIPLLIITAFWVTVIFKGVIL